MNSDHETLPPSATNVTDPRKRLMFVFMVIAIGLRLLFWVMTDRVWEDALITLRHAENAAQGVGLTHHPDHGDPVHGFTSPISVLIPLVAEFLAPNSGMLVLRLSSLVATLVTIWVGYQIAVDPKVDLSVLGTTFFLGFMAVEFHQILFAIGGMETQWIVAITLWVLLQFLRQRPVPLGIACALSLWGRPDGVIVVGAVLIALAACRRWREIPIVVLVCGVLYSPWLIFCTAYYGTFVPHTIIAKKVAFVRSFSETPDWPSFIQAWASELLRRTNFLRLWLSPVYGGTGSAINFVRGARPLQLLYFLIICVGTFYCLRRRDLRFFAIFAITFAAYMLIMLAQPAWWYILPWLNVVAFLFAMGIDRCRALLSATSQNTTSESESPGNERSENEHPTRQSNRWWYYGVSAVPCVYLALYAFGLTRTFPAERHIQLGIEEACRAKIGRWLAEHAEPHEWIACECLGYIGSYSNRPILDYPGLASPRSVAANRLNPEGERTLMSLIDREQPPWLVLRPVELQVFQEVFPDTAAMYEERKRFYGDADHIRAIGDLMWADGFQLTIDEEFVVLSRTGKAS